MSSFASSNEGSMKNFTYYETESSIERNLAELHFRLETPPNEISYALSLLFQKAYDDPALSKDCIKYYLSEEIGRSFRSVPSCQLEISIH